MSNPERDSNPWRRLLQRRDLRMVAWIVGFILVLLLHIAWLVGSHPPPADVALAPPGGKTSAGRHPAPIPVTPTPAPEPASPPTASPTTTPQSAVKTPPATDPGQPPIVYEEHFTDDDAARKNAVAIGRLPAGPRPIRPRPGMRDRLAVIIDDMGYNAPVSLAMTKLPGDVTLAVLPGGHASRAVAESGKASGKEVILHQPMEPMGYPRINPGPGAILVGMSAEQAATVLATNLRLFPEVAGINNHMGSRLTTDRAMMEKVMRALAPTGRFFVDSRTAPASVAFDMAAKFGIPRARRDVFLDNEEDKNYILKQLQLLVKTAHAQHEAVGIGHAYPETLQALREWLPTLSAQGVELVRVSQLLTPPTARKRPNPAR